MRHVAHIALGTNLGDRVAAIEQALAQIGALTATRVLAIADPIETEPIDCPPGSPNYLNSAATLLTDLSAENLLRQLLEIEDELGRVRPNEPAARNAPRPIDLDLLLYDDLVMTSPALTLPHPRMHVRRFVLQPLAQIAPDAVHPTSGRTVAELLRAMGAD